MSSSRQPSVEVSPLQSHGSLYGFMVSGRWPDNTVEWAQFLVLAVRMAAVPGLLPMTTVFSVRDEVPDAVHDEVARDRRPHPGRRPVADDPVVLGPLPSGLGSAGAGGRAAGEDGQGRKGKHCRDRG